MPGSDVTLDFTEAFGGVHYNNRTITLVFLSLEPWSDQMEQDSTVKNALHGKKMKVVFSDDPDYYWIGRVKVGDWEYYKGAGRVNVSIDAEPFKYLGEQTLSFINLGNNKNVYQYYDSFETIDNNTIADRVTGSLEKSIVSSGAKAGRKALKLTLTSGTSGAVVIGTHIEEKGYGRPSLIPGKYIASIYAKTTGNTPAAVDFRVYSFRSPHAVLVQNREWRARTTATISNSWQRLYVEFTIPENTAFPYTALRLQLDTANVDVLFDCAMIEHVDSSTTEPSTWTAATATSATQTVTLRNDGNRAVVPFISTSGAVQMSWTGYSVSVSAGNDFVVPELEIPAKGSLTVTITGAALVSFRYQEESL